jgi:HAD superfamily hydrolase (TIGR01509 family)
MTVAAVAFDINGTLSDDEPVLAAVYAELFAELGRPITAEEYYRELAGHTDEEMLIRWFGESRDEWITERIRRYNERVSDGSTIDDEMRAAVRFAAERVPVALVTAAARAEVDPVLAASGLAGTFSAVVSQDDVTKGKPDPEPYLRAAAELRIEPAALLVFEDTDVGVASAQRAGARVVGLTRTLGAERMAAADELVPRVDVPLVERLLCS